MGLPRPSVRLPALVLQHRGGFFSEPDPRGIRLPERLNPTKMVGQAKCDLSHFRDEQDGRGGGQDHAGDDRGEVQVAAPLSSLDFKEAEFGDIEPEGLV